MRGGYKILDLKNVLLKGFGELEEWSDCNVVKGAYEIIESSLKNILVENINMDGYGTIEYSKPFYPQITADNETIDSVTKNIFKLYYVNKSDENFIVVSEDDEVYFVEV